MTGPAEITYDWGRQHSVLITTTPDTVSNLPTIEVLQDESQQKLYRYRKNTGIIMEQNYLLNQDFMIVFLCLVTGIIMLIPIQSSLQMKIILNHWKARNILTGNIPPIFLKKLSLWALQFYSIPYPLKSETPSQWIKNLAMFQACSAKKIFCSGANMKNVFIP
ncbi:MAG: hypothetical protein OMM_00969 [Candidatus Magnetoglobus multicellularis str. Araruama]|uniref:Uncharacterized protein n=1 Tax=Candidatus Magnetoglobus multicellularis str. Araruama TaxID=890399 RepID=A0A1V1PFH2_9BACT|nr:MAG: hypothetical protein OMM_00969 [Candidatus Magnetoglobus multicellularis str. Araruama]